MSERLVFTIPLENEQDADEPVCMAEIEGTAYISMDHYGDPEIDLVEVDGMRFGKSCTSVLASDHYLYKYITDYLRRVYGDALYEAADRERAGRAVYDREMMR